MISNLIVLIFGIINNIFFIPDAVNLLRLMASGTPVVDFVEPRLHHGSTGVLIDAECRN